MSPSSELAAESIRCAVAGDDDAFSELVAFYSRRLHRTAVSILGNSSDAEEVVQNAFLRFHRYGKSFDLARPLSSYLFRITVTECYRRLEELARSRPVERKDLEFAGWYGRSKGAADKLIETEMIAAVGEILGRLTPRERVCFVLRDVEGREVGEIASDLSISEVTVRRFSGMARGKIAAELEARFGAGAGVPGRGTD